MKYYLFLVIFLISSFLLEGYEVKSRIIDEYGKPISDVAITCDGKMFLSNKNGEFHIVQCSEIAIVNLHKYGFQDWQTKVRDIGGLLILKKKNLSIPGIRIIGKQLERNDIFLNEKQIIMITDGNSGDNLANLISSESLVDISGSNLEGEDKTIALPGFEAKHTLVLLDGVPLNKTGEALDISSIPVASLEKVEISSNQNNGLGGIAVVINLISEKNINFQMKKNFSIAHYQGSYGLNKNSGTAGINYKQWNLWFYLANSKSKNNFKYEVKEYWVNPDSLRLRKKNDKKITDLNFSINKSLGRVNYTYRLLYQDFFKKLPGPTSNPDLYYDSRLTGELERHFFLIDSAVNQWQISGRLFHFSENTRYDNTRISEPWSNIPDYYTLNQHRYNKNGESLEISMEKDWYFFAFKQFLEREEFEYIEQTDSDDSIPLTNRCNQTFTGKLRINQDIGLFSFSESGSFSYIKATDTERLNSWITGCEITFNNPIKMTLGFSLNEGVSLPAFYDLYWKGDAQTLGNPNLEPETSSCINSWLRLDYKNSQIKLHYRETDVENKIIWFPNYNQIWKPMNISGSDVENWGIEMELEIYPNIRMQTAYSHVKALDRTYTSDGSHSAFWGKQLIYTPEESYLCKLEYRSDTMSASINYSYHGEQWSTRDQLNINRKIESYDKTDLKMDYKFSLLGLKFQPSIVVNNIFNSLYEIYEYTPEPGINYQVGLKIIYN